MGIKGFSKVFNHKSIVKFKDLKGKTIGIDAMTEIYRAALGAKSVNLLTDKYGKPTLHISVILSNIIELKRQDVNQLWFFDYPNEEDIAHNPEKINEILKRKKKKELAEKKLFDLDDSESDIDQKSDTISVSAKAVSDKSVVDKSLEAQKNSLEKQTFSLNKEMIQDIKFILNCLNINYVEAPAGYEGEQIASYLSATNQIDAVYSSDTDPIAFGAKVLLRKNPRDKKIYEYTQKDIINQIKDQLESKTTLDDVRKICVILGTDFSPKTPKIGPKTVIKKFKDIELTIEQKKALDVFKKIPSDNIKSNNINAQPFKNAKIKLLLDWLVDERSFSKTRMIKLFSKVLTEEELTK